MKKFRRALVTLPDGVWKVIDKELKGTLGDGDSEVIRNLVIAQLTEKGYLLPSKGQTDQALHIADEFKMLDTMIYLSRRGYGREGPNQILGLGSQT